MEVKRGIGEGGVRKRVGGEKRRRKSEEKD